MKLERLLAQRRYRATDRGKAAQLRYNNKPEIKVKNIKKLKSYRERCVSSSLCLSCAGKNGPRVSSVYCQICLEVSRKRSREASQHKKELIVQHYGAKCACCGETERQFLTIDHINNDGAKQRRELGPAHKFYCWIIKNNFPSTLRILCFNCNCGRAINGGVCPHSKKDS